MASSSSLRLFGRASACYATGLYTICRRGYSIMTSAATTNSLETPRNPTGDSTTDTLEGYVSQLSANRAPISHPPSPSINIDPSEGVIHVPASPSWAMMPHPELYKPPIIKPTHKIHVATLIIEAYNPEKEQLPLICGFALQTAYHLGIPVSRPASMPIKTELHTVLRSGFVHKKSQENFWRLTHRRVIKAYDSNEEVINRWINYLKTEATKGTSVLLKAQRFTYRPIGWGSQLDQLATREAELEILERPKKVTKKKQSNKSETSEEQKPTTTTANKSPGIELSPAEQVKQLAEKLIEEELKPRAEAHEALLSDTGTGLGKSMDELKVTEKQ